LFYEMEYDSMPLNGSVSPQEPQTVKSEIKKDRIREIFAEMREIARIPRFQRSYFNSTVGFYNGNRDAEIFCKQAVFMKDFSDNYGGNAPFNECFPNYQIMGYEQLRTYFTWRTDVRSGKIRETSLSYAYVYVYEILNNIGVESPEDGLYKLLHFWKSYREYDNSIDKNLLKWFRDYHNYYDLGSFDEFVAANGLRLYYAEEIISDSDDMDVWNKISPYNIEKSRFYCDGNQELLKSAFACVIRALRTQADLKKLIFKPISFEREPFGTALFFNKLNKSIQMERMFVTDGGKQFAASLIKTTEYCAREQAGYKYKMRIVTGEYFPTIEKAVAGFFAELRRVRVTVDFANLDRIREEAEATQEKLIVEEEITETPPVSAESAIFTSLETDAIIAVLSGGGLRRFAKERGVMPEILADSINEKAVDLFGDNLLDEDFALYEDYTNKAKEITKNGGSDKNS